MAERIPLKIVWSRVFMLLVRAERTDVARRVVHQTMSHHFVLALEAFPAGSTRTSFDRTEMRSVLGMHVGM